MKEKETRAGCWTYYDCRGVMSDFTMISDSAISLLISKVKSAHTFRLYLYLCKELNHQTPRKNPHGRNFGENQLMTACDMSRAGLYRALAELFNLKLIGKRKNGSNHTIAFLKSLSSETKSGDQMIKNGNSQISPVRQKQGDCVFSASHQRDHINIHTTKETQTPSPTSGETQEKSQQREKAKPPTAKRKKELQEIFEACHAVFAFFVKWPPQHDAPGEDHHQDKMTDSEILAYWLDNLPRFIEKIWIQKHTGAPGTKPVSNAKNIAGYNGTLRKSTLTQGVETFCNWKISQLRIDKLEPDKGTAHQLLTDENNKRWLF